MAGYQKPIKISQIEGLEERLDTLASAEITTYKYTSTIMGDGKVKSFQITHNLNSEDINIVVKYGNDTVLTNWYPLDMNTLQIDFDKPLEDKIKLKITIFG